MRVNPRDAKHGAHHDKIHKLKLLLCHTCSIQEKTRIFIARKFPKHHTVDPPGHNAQERRDHVFRLSELTRIRDSAGKHRLRDRSFTAAAGGGGGREGGGREGGRGGRDS